MHEVEGVEATKTRGEIPAGCGREARYARTILLVAVERRYPRACAERLWYDVVEVTSWQVIQKGIEVANRVLAHLCGQLVGQSHHGCNLWGGCACSTDGMPANARPTEACVHECATIHGGIPGDVRYPTMALQEAL